MYQMLWLTRPPLDYADGLTAAAVWAGGRVHVVRFAGGVQGADLVIGIMAVPGTVGAELKADCLYRGETNLNVEFGTSYT